jgi:hypothetical protein
MSTSAARSRCVSGGRANQAPERVAAEADRDEREEHLAERLVGHYAGVLKHDADIYLGHSDGSMSARYTHQFKGQREADAAALDEYLSGSTAGKIVQLAATG